MVTRRASCLIQRKLKHMNDQHVYDWIDEAEIPKGTKVETSRWLDDIKTT